MDVKHALQVAARFSPLGETNVWHAALLHDCMEDDGVTAAELQNAGLPYHGVIEVIQILTRSEDETYRDYIKRVKFDPVATEIKIADIEANLDRMDPAHINLKPRYTWALNYLKGK